MNEPKGRDVKEKHVDADHTSDGSWLDPADYKKFRPGRSKGDILEDVHWKADFIEATEYKGHSLSAISYGLFKGGGETVTYAIFVDDKFQKFVRWPPWDPKLIKIGDHPRLILAVESEPVSIEDLEREMKALQEKIKANPRTSHVDWGLTIACLIIFVVVWPIIWILTGGRVFRKRRSDYKKNAKLRDQFNATLLEIGMTELEVESVLNAEPIESGEVEAGSFKIYGSTVSLDDLSSVRSHHYTNILVVFREGKVSGIYAIGGGKRGLEHARRQMFVDLPTPKVK